MAVASTPDGSIHALLSIVSQQHGSYDDGVKNITSEELVRVINELVGDGSRYAQPTSCRVASERWGTVAAFGSWLLLCGLDIADVWPDPVAESRLISCSIGAFVAVLLIILGALSMRSLRRSHVQSFSFDASSCTQRENIPNLRDLRIPIMSSAVHGILITGCACWLILHAIAHRGPQVWTGAATLWALVNLAAAFPAASDSRKLYGRSSPIIGKATLEACLRKDGSSVCTETQPVLVYPQTAACTQVITDHELPGATMLKLAPPPSCKWMKVFDAGGSCAFPRPPMVPVTPLTPLTVPPPLPLLISQTSHSVGMSPPLAGSPPATKPGCNKVFSQECVPGAPAALRQEPRALVDPGAETHVRLLASTSSSGNGPISKKPKSELRVSWSTSHTASPGDSQACSSYNASPTRVVSEADGSALAMIDNFMKVENVCGDADFGVSTSASTNSGLSEVRDAGAHSLGGSQVIKTVGGKVIARGDAGANSSSSSSRRTSSDSGFSDVSAHSARVSGEAVPMDTRNGQAISMRDDAAHSRNSSIRRTSNDSGSSDVCAGNANVSGDATLTDTRNGQAISSDSSSPGLFNDSGFSDVSHCSAQGRVEDIATSEPVVRRLSTDSSASDLSESSDKSSSAASLSDLAGAGGTINRISLPIPFLTESEPAAFTSYGKSVEAPELSAVVQVLAAPQVSLSVGVAPAKSATHLGTVWSGRDAPAASPAPAATPGDDEAVVMPPSSGSRSPLAIAQPTITKCLTMPSDFKPGASSSLVDPVVLHEMFVKNILRKAPRIGDPVCLTRIEELHELLTNCDLAKMKGSSGAHVFSAPVQDSRDHGERPSLKTSGEGLTDTEKAVIEGGLGFEQLRQDTMAREAGFVPFLTQQLVDALSRSSCAPAGMSMRSSCAPSVGISRRGSCAPSAGISQRSSRAPSVGVSQRNSFAPSLAASPRHSAVASPRYSAANSLAPSPGASRGPSRLTSPRHSVCMSLPVQSFSNHTKGSVPSRSRSNSLSLPPGTTLFGSVGKNGSGSILGSAGKSGTSCVQSGGFPTVELAGEDDPEESVELISLHGPSLAVPNRTRNEQRRGTAPAATLASVVSDLRGTPLAMNNAKSTTGMSVLRSGTMHLVLPSLCEANGEDDDCNQTRPPSRLAEEGEVNADQPSGGLWEGLSFPTTSRSSDDDGEVGQLLAVLEKMPEETMLKDVIRENPDIGSYSISILVDALRLLRAHESEEDERSSDASEDNEDTQVDVASTDIGDGPDIEPSLLHEALKMLMVLNNGLQIRECKCIPGQQHTCMSPLTSALQSQIQSLQHSLQHSVVGSQLQTRLGSINASLLGSLASSRRGSRDLVASGALTLNRPSLRHKQRTLTGDRLSLGGSSGGLGSPTAARRLSFPQGFARTSSSDALGSLVETTEVNANAIHATQDQLLIVSHEKPKEVALDEPPHPAPPPPKTSSPPPPPLA